MKLPKSMYEIRQLLGPIAIIIIMGILFFIITLGTADGLSSLFGLYMIIPRWTSTIMTLFIVMSSSILVDRYHNHIGSLSQILTTVIFSITIGELIAVIGIIITDLCSRLGWSTARPMRIGYSLMIVFLIGAIWGIIYGKHHYVVRRIKLEIPHLPQTFQGYSIVQISDIHSGSLYSRRGIQKGIDLINAQKPDLFVFTGDLVNNYADEFAPRKDLFQSIQAQDGCYAILGNHDYAEYVSRPDQASKDNNMKDLQQHYRDMGWKLLLDEHVSIRRGKDHIALVGIQNRGDGFSQYGDLDQATYGIHPDEITILLSHDPTHRVQRVRYYPNKHIHLTLSGHTHGMQMGFDRKDRQRSPIKRRYPYWIGLYEEDGKHLYVNRGFGVLGFLGRIGIRPEITVIELQKK